VPGLANEEFLVEIEPVAVIHERTGSTGDLPALSG